MYETCRESSASYLRELRSEYAVSSRRVRHHPYHRNLRPGRQAPSRGEEKSKSLMENISKICSHFWRKARSHPSDPRKREASAIQKMQDFYAWGELVSRGNPSNRADNMSDDGESSTGSVSDSIETANLEDAAEAAITLCDAFYDTDAVLTCKGFVEELRVLGGRGADLERGFFWAPGY